MAKSRILSELREEQSKPKAEKKAEAEPKPKAEEKEEKEEKEDKVRFQAILPNSLYEKLRTTAFKDRVSMNSILVQAIEKHFERSK